MNFEEKRELRLQISQMLADVGLNQGTLKEMVIDTIIEVVCRAGEGKVSHHQDVSAWLDKEYKGKDGQDER